MKNLVLLCLVFLFSHNCLAINYYSKAWRHRGGNPQNTVSGARKAIKNGYKGIEIDLFYFNDEIILSHDFPKKDKTYVTLSSFLSQVSTDNLNIWLDFKNLNLWNCNQIGKKLKLTLASKNFLKSSFVESKRSILCLGKLKKMGLNAIYWFEPSSYKIVSFFRPKLLSSIVKWLDLDGISFDHRVFSTVIEKYFGFSSWHVFTINDLDTFKSFSKKENVKVILTDLDHINTIAN